MRSVVGRGGDVRGRAYIRLMLAGVATREAARFMQRGGARDKGHGAPMKRPAGWLQRLRPFGIGARWSGRPLARPDFGCGCSSGVEHDLAKVGVDGSNPFARSKITSEKSSQRRGAFDHFASVVPPSTLLIYVKNVLDRGANHCRS